MSDDTQLANHADTQAALDKAAFLDVGLLPTKSSVDRPYLSMTGLPEGADKTLAQIQEMAWNAALKWERESPKSLSSKRIDEYRKLLE